MWRAHSRRRASVYTARAKEWALEFSDLVLLWAVAFVTSVLSAVAGLAGGAALLAVLLLFLPPLVAIPLHGVIQLCSNGARTFVQRRHVSWRIVGAGCVLLLPAGALGLLFGRALPEALLRAAIGGFVLLATWSPGVFTRAAKLAGGGDGGDGVTGTHTNLRRRFLWLGGASGFLGVTIGASGPLTAPFFLNLGLRRQAVIGSNAAFQSASHFAKILLFGGAGFAFREHAPLLAGSALAVTAGTWVGSRLLEHTSELWFTRLYKTVLTLLALRLLFGEVARFVGR